APRDGFVPVCGGLVEVLVQRGGERAAADGAAAVAAAVGADQQDGVLDAAGARGVARGAQVDVQEGLDARQVHPFEDGFGAGGPGDIEHPGVVLAAVLAFPAGAADELEFGPVVLEEGFDLRIQLGAEGGAVEDVVPPAGVELQAEDDFSGFCGASELLSGEGGANGGGVVELFGGELVWRDSREWISAGSHN